MEHVESTQSEQGKVSTRPGGSPKDKTKKTMAKGEVTCNRARDKLLSYMANKFTFKQQKQLYKRFLIEAQAAWAGPTPGNLVSTEEHHSYDLEKIRKTLELWTPSFQKKLLLKYIMEVLPSLEKDFDIGQDEACLIALLGDVHVAAKFATCVNLLHNESVKFIEGLTKRMKDRAKKR